MRLRVVVADDQLCDVGVSIAGCVIVYAKLLNNDMGEEMRAERFELPTF